MTKLGRSLGSGKFRREDRGGGAQWVLDFKDASGKRHRQALGPDKRVAERRRAEIISQRDLEEGGLGPIEGQSRPVSELVPLYLDDLRHRVGSSQIANVPGRIERVLRAIRAPRVRDIRPIDVIRFRNERLKSGVSNRTANLDIDAVKAMLNWAVRMQLIAENPLRNLSRLPTGAEHQRHQRRALSEGEIERFLNASREDDSDGDARVSAELTISKGWKGLDFARKPRTVRVPQTPLWSALIETGARWSELTNTTWNDLDVERRALTLRAETTKSGRSRMVPLRSEMVETLIALKAVHQQRHKRITRSTDRIFLSPEGFNWRRDTAGARRILHRILERAGIDRRDEQGKCLDIHALRHTAASRMAARGVPITIAQKVLGHSDPKLTAAVYTHLEVEDLRVAVDEPPMEPRRAAL